MKKLLFVLLFVALLTGCGSSNIFIGTWYSFDGEEFMIFTFNKDGTCSIEQGELKKDCKYSFDDEKIEIESNSNKVKDEYYFEKEYVIIDDIKFYHSKQIAKENPQNKDVFIKGSKMIKVPDVSGLTIEEAKKVLTSRGFVVDSNIIEANDSDIPKDKVIKTIPTAGRERPKGTSITIYKSIGLNEIIVEEYIGKKYIEVMNFLQQYGVKVYIEKVGGHDGYSSDTIVSQSVKAGTHLSEGDYITLYIPDVYDTYPDFVNEAWNLEEIQEFAKKYELSLNIKYISDTNKTSGTIISQSRTGKIVKGSTLMIEVIK